MLPFFLFFLHFDLLFEVLELVFLDRGEGTNLSD